MYKSIQVLLITIVLLSLSTFAQGFHPFPDTGQTRCYDDENEITCPQPGQPFYGQDAQYQPRIPRSYTKLGHGGAILDDAAAHVDNGGPWIMTRDDVTGLIWEVKTDDNKSDRYNWNDAQDSFISNLNQEEYGGFSDWRLPDVKELSSLINSGTHAPAIEKFYFPNTALSTSYWSSTDYTFSRNQVWLVQVDGNAHCNYITHSYMVRAVRAGPPQQQNLTDNQDGTVTDSATGLMWQKCTYGQTWDDGQGTCTGSAASLDWQQSLEAAENLELAGHDDWRLPNRNELQSLADYSRHAPAIDPMLWDSTELANYWSSTTRADFTDSSMIVDFNFARIDTRSKSDNNHVRAVRDDATTGQYGSLTILIEPSGARDAGAQWRRTGTSKWFSSGFTETNVLIGSHTVEFKVIGGWITPEGITVSISEGETTTATGTYISTEMPVAGTPSFIDVPSTSTTGNYSVDWGSSVTREVTYVLEEATNSSFTSGLSIVYTGTNLVAPITGRTDGTYYYRVKATKEGYEDSKWVVGNNGCLVKVGDNDIVVTPIRSETITFSDFINTGRNITWIRLWTGSQVNGKYVGSYVNTNSFNTFGDGWIEVVDMEKLKLDFAQFENTILYLLPWSANSSHSWQKFEVDFQASNQVKNSVNMNITMDTYANEIIKVENTENGSHWLQLWTGNIQNGRFVGSYILTQHLNIFGNGWVEVRHLPDLVIPSEALKAGNSLWVRQSSQSHNTGGWVDYGWIEIVQDTLPFFSSLTSLDTAQ
ncbi:DUF1566 domain-containing protein [Desulfonatronovibrio magnus]|uniref:Lcl C-terminal domain-containing protein n=1 Tax=Desulfonatronovibrio magnus TaxID=698827 RepID=UPI0005EAFEC1|nr:DUF1566 domain-containing protein [Desulfonatronovibrio magnus]